MALKLSKFQEITTYDKWKELQEYYYKEGYGEIFNPVALYEKYGYSLFENLNYKRDYKVKKVVSFGTELRAELEMHFTKKGIKKLLKTNQEMIGTIESLWADYCEKAQDFIEMEVQSWELKAISL